MTTHCWGERKNRLGVAAGRSFRVSLYVGGQRVLASQCPGGEICKHKGGKDFRKKAGFPKKTVCKKMNENFNMGFSLRP